MFLGKSTAYLGIDIGAGGVKVIELKKEKKRPVLFTYGLTKEMHDIHRLLEKTELHTEALVSGKLISGEQKAENRPMFQIDREQISALAGVIRKICAKAKTVSKVAVASLPVSSVFHAVVTLPMVKKDDFERILRAEVKKLLPYPIEETILEWEVVPGKEHAKQQRVLVNAAPRALVVFYTEVFKLAGLKLESLEPESIALTRALVGRDESTTMLIDIGAERTNFFIVENTFPMTHHSVELGGGKINQILENVLKIEPGLVEQMKQDLFTYILRTKENQSLTKENFLDLLSPVIQPIIKEIDYSLDLHMRQSNDENKKPEKIILSGGSALFPYLAEKIGEKFQLKCYVGDPWGRVVYQDALKPILRSIAPRLSVAIGLALRNVV